MLGDLPIFPLNTVLFPGGVLPLRIFEARYMDMARDCLAGERPFGVCLITEGKEVGEAAEAVGAALLWGPVAGAAGGLGIGALVALFKRSAPR